MSEESINRSIIQQIFDVDIWPRPASRDFAELSDPILYAEVLEVAYKEGKVSLNKLTSDTDGLRKRLRGLWVIDRPTNTTIRGLLSAMNKYGWLREEGTGIFSLTELGEDMYILSKDEKKFRETLIVNMHGRYIIPGWFVSRLHNLNPTGNGEIVLPSPPRQWSVNEKQIYSADWSDDIEEQVEKSADQARKLFPGSFPIDNRFWIEVVKENWFKSAPGQIRSHNLLGARNKEISNRARVRGTTVRARLAQAMRDAAVILLFATSFPIPLSHPVLWVSQFKPREHPIPPRAFRAWCPRLDALELAFYTDHYPSLSGRLLFPCSVFRNQAEYPPFKAIPGVVDPSGRTLCLYQPTWQFAKDEFVSVMLDTYQRFMKKAGALYVSLLDLRDEICRQLRLSSIIFDYFLETAYREAMEERKPLKNIAISIESDVRMEQRLGYSGSRRPVYVNKVPHSLIAISVRRR